MTTVTVTPSQQIIKEAAKEITTQDARGREITLRKPGPLNKLRFFEAMGESSINPLWSSVVSPLMFVSAIEGEPVLTPSTKREIEALYQRLDEDGMTAIGAALPGNFGISGGEVNEEAVKK
ncbi:hypothetical protein [Cupriavidus basilensis]|uniref:hypothetical protein n=1 Tax=Cupriavidus basilensis TaxID=68895 RepID=UPI00204993A7|nr:hypothetical protein [Cupriavidus basilensis]MCP3017547.1 hypothetical protein [Cupriavidus basilensis]DAT37697.1 MAG TPA: hypothetical protein [Caudoviricetes sp.]